MKSTRTRIPNSKPSGNSKSRAAPLQKRSQETRMITHTQAELVPSQPEHHPTPPEQGEQDWSDRKRVWWQPSDHQMDAIWRVRSEVKPGSPMSTLRSAENRAGDQHSCGIVGAGTNSPWLSWNGILGYGHGWEEAPAEAGEDCPEKWVCWPYPSAPHLLLNGSLLYIVITDISAVEGKLHSSHIQCLLISRWSACLWLDIYDNEIMRCV